MTIWRVMFAWWRGPWLVRVGAGYLMLISPPADIAAPSRHSDGRCLCQVLLRSIVRGRPKSAVRLPHHLWPISVWRWNLIKSATIELTSDFIRRLSDFNCACKSKLKVSNDVTRMRSGILVSCIFRHADNAPEITTTNDVYSEKNHCVRQFKLSLSHPRLLLLTLLLKQSELLYSARRCR